MTIYKTQGNQQVLNGVGSAKLLRSRLICLAAGRQKNTADNDRQISVTPADGGRFIEMQKETIIYFEQLGFGWVLDYMVLKEIKFTKLRDECMTEASLIKIIENMLIENPNF